MRHKNSRKTVAKKRGQVAPALFSVWTEICLAIYKYNLCLHVFKTSENA